MTSFRKFLTLLLCLGSTSIIAQTQAPSPLPLMPVPESVTQNGQRFVVNKGFTVSVKTQSQSRLYSGASRFLRRLSGRTGLFFEQDFLTPDKNPASGSLTVTNSESPAIAPNIDESYSLKVTSSSIVLEAKTDIGALRGLETLLQLLNSDTSGYYFEGVEIKDKPRFTWRGLMLDVARHYMPLEVVRRNLDGMAAMKLNVFHWHLSEDQGFRVESKKFPKLHELGSDGWYYTQDEIKAIVKYADERGIRVVPEFDVPGHSTAWFVGYPEYASAPGPYTIERRWGVFDPTFDPTKEETYKFFKEFFTEITALFPDLYFHIGGDENNGKQWNANPDIQKFMKENNLPDNHALQGYFNNRILEILTNLNKRMIGWDEILHPSMPKNIVIHSWRGKEALYKSAQQGYDGILSNGFYIDLNQSAEFHYKNDPIPPDAPLNDAEKARILGGEATMWAELVTPENVDMKIWSRMPAIAERLWSPQSVNDVDDMYNRMQRIWIQLEEHGLQHMSASETMFRRMMPGENTNRLVLITSILIPVKNYDRHGPSKKAGMPLTSFAPYTRVIDALSAESMVARTIGKLIDKVVASNDAEANTTLGTIFNYFIFSAPELIAEAKGFPILHEIFPHINNIEQLGMMSVSALAYKAKGEKMPADELQRFSELLEKSKEKHAQVELAIVPHLERLRDAVK